jgi:hypothetical protein
LKTVLIGGAWQSEKSADLLIDERGEFDVQRHATYCLWLMRQGKVHIPPAWLTASLDGEWSAALNFTHRKYAHIIGAGKPINCPIMAPAKRRS